VQQALETDGGERVYAFARTRDTNIVVVAVNFGEAAKRVTYRGLPQPGRYTDWFSRTDVTLGASGSLELPAHGYRVLVR
jgi:hypothetical protein